MSHNDSQDLSLLIQQVNQLYQEGRFPEAIELATRAGKLARQSYGKGHAACAASLDKLAMLYENRADYALALPLYRLAREIRRGTLDEAASLQDIARSCAAIGDPTGAYYLFNQSLAIYRTANLRKCHSDYTTCLHNYARWCRDLGNHDSALPLYQEALNLNSSSLGENHKGFAASLGKLAELYRDIGDYTAALPVIRQAVEMRRKTHGEKDSEYAASLHTLAVLYRDVGDVATALQICDQAVEIRRSTCAENDPECAANLDTLAGLYREIGDHAAALTVARQVRNIYCTTLGESHPDYARSLNSLAELYRDMGDYTAALPLYLQALEIRRTTLGENHMEYAQSLNDLGLLYRDTGRYKSASSLYRQSLEVYGNALENKHPRELGPDDTMEMEFPTTDERRLGAKHPRYATCLNNLAQLCLEMGDQLQAERYCNKAGNILRPALGEDHPDYANTLSNLALSYAARGLASEATPLMSQVMAIDDRMIGQILAVGSDRQRIAYLCRVQRRLHMFLSLVLQHLNGSPDAIHAAFDLVLRRKAIAGEALATQRDTVMGGKYPALKPKLIELAALRMQIAHKTLAGPGPKGLEDHSQVLAEWNARRERLEAELARQIPEMNLEQKLRAADRRAVALSLPERVALAEFVRVRVFDFQAVRARGEPRWTRSRYLAFVLAGGEPENVQMIDLGKATPIDRLIADFRAAIIAEADPNDGRDMAKPRERSTAIAKSDSGLGLRTALLDRLSPWLRDQTRLLIAPDGDLTRLPFEVLPTEDGRRLIDDYQISYLSCGRDVLRFRAAATGRADEPLVVADPDFDLGNLSVGKSAQPKGGFWSRLLGRGKKATATPTQPAQTFSTTACFAGRRSRDLDRDPSAHHFHRLPGTRAEGERVAALLDVSPWLDAAALEGRLKSACRSPRILHLATHGFFLPDQERDLNREGRDLDVDFGGVSVAREGLARFSGPMMENPMLRSGLALAGANTWLAAGNLPEEAEDGLLTAEDVTGLDLLATELVVLSACETGLGQVHIGEGVFGLRRAFVLAGAKTLVMSLWKVPDEPTRELMEAYYGRLLAGEGRAEALRQAQLALKAKYTDPFYWGAFICQGDPSPLGKVESRKGRSEAVAG